MTGPACLLCRGPLRPWMTVAKDASRPALPCRRYDLYWCDACALGQLQPRPSQEEVDGFYEDYYTHSDAPRARAEPSFWERVRCRVAWTVDRGSDLDADLIHRHVGAVPSRILDVGCGAGRLLAELRDRGHEVVGLEPDPAARRLAEARGLTVLAGHAEQMPEALQDGRFDVVILAHVLHQCLDPLSSLRSVRRALRPGGAMFCEVTNNEVHGLARLGACWPWLDVPRHLTLFTGRSLVEACAAAGLVATSVRYTGYTRQFRRAWIEDAAARRAILHPERPGGPLRDALRTWALLLRTAAAAPARKYDSVRVVAKPARGRAAAPGSDRGRDGPRGSRTA